MGAPVVEPVRGTIVVLPAAPEQEGTASAGEPAVVLQPRDGGAPIEVVAPDPGPISRVAGGEVVVFGRFDRERGRIRLVRFVLVAMWGVPAVDGMLEGDGERLTLVTEDGARLPIGSHPPALLAFVGGRVWLSGWDLSSGPDDFGVIRYP